MERRNNSKHELITEDMIQSYCNIFGIDVESVTEGVLKAMEDSMQLNKEKRVYARHPYALPDPESYANGRQKTRVKSEDSPEKRKTIWAKSHKEMIDKLYNFYYTDEQTFEVIFEKMCEFHEEYHIVRPKTIREYRKEYERFFKDDPIAKTDIQLITVSGLSMFLMRAHQKTTKKDLENGYNVIEKHRHQAIKGIINKVYNYANQYMDISCVNPLDTRAIDYNMFPHYDADRLEHDGYSSEDIHKLLEYFDSLEHPTIPQLAVGAIFETLARNSEIRALRFCDFHFDAPQPYVRICGMACGSTRENRVKKDSSRGMRNIAITPRLKRIYDIGKEISWSDEYIFPKDIHYVTESDKKDNNICVSMQSVQRALMHMCKKTGIKYYSPHQIRFYGAMAMMNETCDIYATANLLGHSTLAMTKKYSDKLNSSRVYAGPLLA